MDRTCHHGLRGECEPCDLTEQRDELYGLLWEAIQALEWVEEHDFVEGIRVVPCFVAQWAARERQRPAAVGADEGGEP